VTEEEFSKSLTINDSCFGQMLNRIDKLEPSLSAGVDWHIIWYCRRQLKLASKVVPEFLEISAHIARCFLELEVILKWLKQTPENYKIFCAAAEHANLDLMKSKKDAIEIYASQFVEKFENSIKDIKKDLEQLGHVQYQDKLSPLFDIKGTSKKLDEGFGKLVRAKFDYYSKMSHPTAWLILKDPHSGEEHLIKKEAMSEINRAAIIILNTLNDSYKPLIDPKN
jgi:hypothetical protein